jgi:hypothetical protein
VIHYDWGPSGYCPVQADGTFDGEPFYFRSRGMRARVEVNSVLVYEEQISDKSDPYAAGYLDTSRARAIVKRAYRRWKRARQLAARSASSSSTAAFRSTPPLP